MNYFLLSRVFNCKRILYLVPVFLLFCVTTSWSQNSFNSSSTTASNSTGHISYTVGQAFAINEASGNNGHTYGGIQQPYYLYTLGTDDPLSSAIAIEVYPNPVNDFLFLSVPDNELDHLIFKLSGIHGTPIIEFKNLQSVNLKLLPDGLYLLTAYKESRAVKSFRVIKK